MIHYTTHPSDILTYKRSNWGFRKQGAVDNSLYIANKKLFANPCCCVCYQQLRIKTSVKFNNNDIGRYLAFGDSRGILVDFQRVPGADADTPFHYSISVALSDCNKPFNNTQDGDLVTNLPGVVKPSVSGAWTTPATSCDGSSVPTPDVQSPNPTIIDPAAPNPPVKPQEPSKEVKKGAKGEKGDVKLR